MTDHRFVSSPPPPTQLGGAQSRREPGTPSTRPTLPPSKVDFNDLPPAVVPRFWDSSSTSGGIPGEAMLHLLSPLIVCLPAVTNPDGDELTEVILRIPMGVRIPATTPPWEFRSALVLAHFSESPGHNHKSNALEWSTRIALVDMYMRNEVRRDIARVSQNAEDDVDAIFDRLTSTGTAPVQADPHAATTVPVGSGEHSLDLEIEIDEGDFIDLVE